MENCDELSRHELLALKEIRLTGRTTDPKMAIQLLNDDMIIDSQERCLPELLPPPPFKIPPAACWLQMTRGWMPSMSLAFWRMRPRRSAARW